MRYLVISYDGDCAETYYDFVIAKTERRAGAIISKARRDYAHVVAIYTPEELRNTAAALMHVPAERVQAVLENVRADSREDVG